MPKTRPQCTSRPGSVPEHVGVADRGGRGLVQARRVAQRALDEVVEQRDRDVGEQQAADRLVDAAVLAQRAGQRDPAAPPAIMPADGHRQLDRRPARAPAQEMPGARRRRARRAPAPLRRRSPSARPRGQRGAERGQDQRRRARAACSATRTRAERRRGRSARRPRAGSAPSDRHEERRTDDACAAGAARRRRSRAIRGSAEARPLGPAVASVGGVGPRHVRPCRASDLPDDALDQVVHLLEHDVGLLLLGARRR